MPSPHSHRPGAMLLLVVLITGAVMLGVTMGVALRGIGELDTSQSTIRSSQARNIAEGCAEDALRRLWLKSGFAGTSLTIGNGSCTSTVTANASLRTIIAVGTVQQWTRRVRVTAQLTSTGLTVIEWTQTAR